MKRVLCAVAIGISLGIIGVGINGAIAHASTNVCWTKSATHTFGSWWTGFGQRVSDTTTFCANGSKTKLVYRATHVSYNTVLCWENSKTSYKLSSNAIAVDWVDEVHFTCPEAIPGYFVHLDDKIALQAVANGQYTLYWNS